jgi:tetratricopeptide (TPR) repeat protein
VLTNILKLAIPLIIIIVCFIYNTLLGILSIVLFIAYLFYNSRANIYMFIGNSHFNKGDREKAKKWTEKAFKTEPKQVGLGIAYGYLLIKMGEIDEADAVLSNLSQKDIRREDEMSLKLNKSIVLWKQGKQEESIELASELHSKFKNSILYGTLGYYYVLNGDFEKALQFNEEAYEYNDTNTAILDNLGFTYYKLQEYEKAFEIYEKLMTLNPKFPEAYYNFGLLYEHRGEMQQAHEYFKKSLDYKESLVSHLSKEEVIAKINELETKHQIEE